MKRIFEIRVNLTKGISYGNEIVFTQGDNQTHYLKIIFEDKFDFNGKSMKINFIKPNRTSVFSMVTELKSENEIIVPNNALTMIGDILIEIVLIDGERILTVNSLGKFIVTQTVAGAELVMIPGDTLISDINDLILQLNEFMRHSKEELDQYTSDKKLELDNHKETKKQELNTHTSSKKEEINNHVTTKELEIDQLVEGEKVELNSHTNIKKTELDKYIVDNRAALKGEKGDKGEKGEAGSSVDISGKLDKGNVTEKYNTAEKIGIELDKKQNSSDSGLKTNAKTIVGGINEIEEKFKNLCPFSNYKGIYNEDTSYAIGDVVKVTGHESCYVFETTLCEMSDPQHPKYFRKVYKIEDTMYYVKEKDGFEILFTKEEKIPFYTIPKKGEQQNYKSTVDDYFPYSDIRGVVFDGFVGTTIAQILDKNDATKQSNGSPSNLTTLGNVMNEYPKFYCQVKMTPQGRRYRIFSYKNPTKKIAMGIKPHPVFKKPDGSYKNFEYLSRYEGSYDGTSVVSLSEKSPYASTSQGTFRDRCRNGRNTNWNMLTFEQISMLQCLYIVEFGDLNSQAVLGQGRTSTTSASATGTCNALGMRSGRISDDANENVCYRGLEDFYGNTWDFIDGFMITDMGYHYTNDPSKFGNLSAMTLFPKNLNFKIENGYVDKMEVIDGYEHLLIPYGTTGSATTYYCDHFWSHETGKENTAFFGGAWGYGAFCGCFCLGCDFVAFASGANIGGRLSVFV
ncbi:hypothetical protein [Fusobacterium ulcerans]